MKRLSRHLTRCFLACAVALLPIVGVVATLAWVEGMLAGSWLARQAWYVPGLGIVITAATVYLIGLLVSTLVGRWVIGGIDRLAERLPGLGNLYATLKQILGYGSGKDAIFRAVVLIPSANAGGEELALVTGEQELDGVRRLTLFVPGAPNPTAGRVVLIDAARVRPVAMEVHAALRLLLAVGAGEEAPGAGAGTGVAG